MRTCIRCETEMLEGLDIRETMYNQMLRATRPGTSGMLPKNYFGDLKAAVFPRCGYVETYLSRLDKNERYDG